MNTKLTFLTFSTVLLGFAATALLFKADQAIAQQSDEGIEEVVVIETPAPETRHVRIGRDLKTVTELGLSVDYSDLDLTLHTDIEELMSRINASAIEVCKRLADEEPWGREPVPSCVESAVASATKKADEVIAAANEVFVAAH